MIERPWEAWYDTADEHEGRAARMVEIFRWVDERYPDRIEELEIMLSQIDVRRLSSVVALGVLTATWPHKEQMPSRPAFVDAVRALLVERVGQERADRLVRDRR